MIKKEGGVHSFIESPISALLCSMHENGKPKLGRGSVAVHRYP